jgi:VanZ family protein
VNRRNELEALVPTTCGKTVGEAKLIFSFHPKEVEDAAQAKMLRVALLVSQVLLTGCVVIGSVSPSPSPALALVHRFGANDGLLHFTAYATLAVVGLPLPICKGEWQQRFICLFVLGVVLEYLQRFIPGRLCEWDDVLANMGGGVFGLLVTRALGICRAADFRQTL